MYYSHDLNIKSINFICDTSCYSKSDAECMKQGMKFEISRLIKGEILWDWISNKRLKSLIKSYFKRNEIYFLIEKWEKEYYGN